MATKSSGLTLTNAFGTLAPINQVKALLAKETSLEVVDDFDKRVESARRYDRDTFERRHYWTEVRAASFRRVGELIVEGQENGKIAIHGRPNKNPDTLSGLLKTLDEVLKCSPEKAYQKSSRSKRLLAIAEEDVESYFADALDKEEEASLSGLLRKYGAPPAASNSGEIEWYTPPEYAEMAREVMGSIDLDPASNETANGFIKATTFFSESDSGLERDWLGNVWMNPPYANGVVGKFTAHLLDELYAKRTKQAVVLLNNATDTQWFADCVRRSACICFKTGRIAFINSEGERVAGAAQGQVFLYFGKRVARFADTFGKIGWIAEVRNDG